MTLDPDGDPTKIRLHPHLTNEQYEAVFSPDPLVRRLNGVAAHGYTKFDMPFVTQVEGNLWHGGCESGLEAPDFFKHIVSLYPWERYIPPKGGWQTELSVVMYDSTAQGFHQIENLAAWVASCVADGPTLVHCQAGLNRSSLVVARTLIDSGYNPKDAVALMRSVRSPAVLCNPAFAEWVLGGAGHPDFTDGG